MVDRKVRERQFENAHAMPGLAWSQDADVPEEPVTQLPVRTSDMVRIFRDLDRGDRPNAKTASEMAYEAVEPGMQRGAGSPKVGADIHSRRRGVSVSATTSVPRVDPPHPAAASRWVVLNSAVSTATGAPAAPTASHPASDPQPPGQTLTVRLLDRQSNVIAMATVPLIGSWPDGFHIGDMESGAIQWRGGESISVVIGTAFDAKHRPIGGMPIEKWVHQYPGAKFILVQIERARFDGSENQAGGDHEANANLGTPSETGSKPDSNATASGSTAASTAGGGVVRSGGNGDQTNDGSYNTSRDVGPGKLAGGAESGTQPDGRNDTQAGGTRTRGHSGDRDGQKHGSTLGKKDGKDEQVGFFWKPTNAGGGTYDIGSENGSVDGMVGGEHAGGKLGIPEGLGAKPRFPIPAEWAAAVSLAAILIQAEVQSVAAELFAAVKVLGPAAAKATLRPLVRASVDQLAEQNLAKALKILGKEAKYAGKTAEEIEHLVRVEAAEQLSKEFEKRIAAAEKAAQANKAKITNEHAQAALAEEQAHIDAAKEARKLLSEETDAARNAVAQSEKSKQAAREAEAASKREARYDGTPGDDAAQTPRYDGPKPNYDVNPAHVPGRGMRALNSKTPLPADAEQVFRSAVPNHPETPTAWFGKNADGQVYRYSLGNNGTAHFSGIRGVGDGTRNFTPYAAQRLGVK